MLLKNGPAGGFDVGCWVHGNPPEVSIEVVK